MITLVLELLNGTLVRPLCIACLSGILSISTVAASPNRNEEKIKTLQGFDVHKPSTVKEWLSQMAMLASIFPERLQADKPSEGLLLGKASYNLDQLVEQFCQNRRWQSPETATVLAEFLIRFDQVTKAAAMPNYKIQYSPMNISPPAGSAGVTSPGMDPAMIKNPVKRAQYETAIADNERKNSINIMYATLQDETRSSKIRVRRVLRSLRIKDSLVDQATFQKLKLIAKS